MGVNVGRSGVSPDAARDNHKEWVKCVARFY